MKTINKIALFLVILSFTLNVFAMADEIESDIKNSLESYKSKKYGEAIVFLDSASQKIRKIKAGNIETVFPDPLIGWTAKNPESSAIGSMFMGGAISASRVYANNRRTIRIEIVSDSPLISMVSGMLSNPMIVAASPMLNIKQIKGESAILEWDSMSKTGSAKVVIDNKILITISGNNCKEEDIIDYANAIDYGKIRDLS
jgi:hypothetical protein